MPDKKRKKQGRKYKNITFHLAQCSALANISKWGQQKQRALNNNNKKGTLIISNILREETRNESFIHNTHTHTQT